MLSPDDETNGVAPGAASASAIRAIDVPMTRAICTAASVSTRPMATMRLEGTDGLEVHFGEGRVVVAHVQEAEGAPEPSGVLGRDRGEGGDLGLGQPVAGRDQQPVDDQEVDHIVVHGPVDLLVGAPDVEKHGSDPGERLDVLGVALGSVLGVALGTVLAGERAMSEGLVVGRTRTVLRSGAVGRRAG